MTEACICGAQPALRVWKGGSVKKLSCGHVVADPHQTHYCDYLRLGEFLSLQPGRDEVRHPDEHLFVVTHQSFELWFSQLRFDMRRTIEALQADDVPLATWLVQRCAAVVKLLSPMMRMLETIFPRAVAGPGEALGA